MNLEAMERLKQENAALKTQLRFTETKLSRLEASYYQLQDQLKHLLRDRFGSKSERYVDPENPQQTLFDPVHVDRDDTDEQDTSNVVSIAAHQRRKKQDKTKHLPRRVVMIPVLEKDRHCGCGEEKVVIRYETMELYHYQQPVYEIIEEKREVVACPKGCCGEMKIAPLPKRILPKVGMTGSFLAHIITSKVDDRQPLYHQEKQLLARFGIELSRNTLSRYVIRTAQVLQPLYNLMQDQCIEYDVSACDATSLQVLKEPGRSAQRKSYAYCMRGGPLERSVILYAYNAADHKSFVQKWFADFKGYLHVDADPFFDQIGANPSVTLSYCNAHARRKFETIVNNTLGKPGLAHDAMRFYGKLYKIERRMKRQNVSPTERHAIRQSESKPLLHQLKVWLEEVYPTVLPKSPIGQAIAYCLNHWAGLIVFLQDGRLEFDNNLTEQEIKPFVMSRKNFLFCDTPAGADALCVHFSLVRTAKYHGWDPYRYYTAVFEKLPTCETLEDYEQLLPWNATLREAIGVRQAQAA